MLTQWFPTYAFLKPDHKKQSDFLEHGVRNQYNAGSEAYLGPDPNKYFGKPFKILQKPSQKAPS